MIAGLVLDALVLGLLAAAIVSAADSVHTWACGDTRTIRRHHRARRALARTVERSAAMTTPLDDLDAVVACAELVGRSGGRQFEVGYLDDTPPHRWYAQARYHGARLTADEHDSPDHACDALARRILTGGHCTHCHQPVTLDDTVAGCRWARHGPHWLRGCDTQRSAMTPWVLDLAINPVPLGRARTHTDTHGNVRTVTPGPSRAFAEAFQWAVRACPHRPRQPITGPLDVTFAFWRRCQNLAHRGDLSNLVKAVEDAGNGLLWADDRQITRIDAQIVDAGPTVTGRVVVTITAHPTGVPA